MAKTRHLDLKDVAPDGAISQSLPRDEALGARLTSAATILRDARTRLSALLVCLVLPGAPLFAEQPTGTGGTNEITIVSLQGTAEISTTKGADWIRTQTEQPLKPSYWLRTGPNSRVRIRLSDQSVVSFGAMTEIEILPPHEEGALSGLQLFRGILSFFHRDQPGRIRVLTRGAAAGVEGTEFVMAVDPARDGQPTTLSVIEGTVQFTNSSGALTLTSQQQAVAELGKAPVRTAVVAGNNVLQWFLYYPAVLDLRDLRLTPEEERALAASLAAYRSGDLLGALAEFPGDRKREIEDGRSKVSEAERVYYAALLLSVGQVEQTEAALSKLSAGGATERIPRLATALRVLIAAVKLQPSPSTINPQRSTNSQLSTELLASSYYEQSRAAGDESLKAALRLARQAATNSPDFGFAWERVAELEFSFGNTGGALEALNKSLELAPRNAQALALKGFLLAAQNRTREAIGVFDQAIAADSALGNAWLGRGLCRIRLGEGPRTTDHGPPTTFSSHFGPLPPAIAPLPSPLSEPSALDDLLIAAALEPQRSLLRSYLGKAYADAGDDSRASKELRLARELDKNDPTPWLYSALLKQQQNRINEAVADLETSQTQNDNRSLFRSRLLLDEDRAVRSANLASIYRDAGMTDVSVREAARAATYDYANDSAHLFLSDSFNELRDPTRFNLRYETVWFNELLLANLLSPVGGGRLSQHVSQQEYSRLFEADGLHLANSTLARSDNKSVMELASQFGTFGKTSYSLDLDYDYQRGVRPNNDLSSIEWYSTIKQQITPQDTALALIKYEDYHSGDNFQYYNPANARPSFRFDEYQHPIAVGAWHHEWSPGIHTLVLGGRLENEQFFTDKAAPQLLLIPTVPNYGSDSVPFDARYHGQLEIYTAELNQIVQWNRLTLSAGARYQDGTFDTTAQLYNPARLNFFFRQAATNAISASEDFERITGYGYLTVEPVDRLWLTAGLAYDDLTYPSNFRHPPLSSGEDHRSQLGPKAAFVWHPLPLSDHAPEGASVKDLDVTLRGSFTRSLGGASLDESYRLEPTQLAGFPQAFRSLISESVVGSVSAPKYQTYGLALDLRFPTGTYAGVQAERLETDVRRTIGVFVPTTISGSGFIPPFIPSSTGEELDYHENSISVSLDQLVGKEIVLGASYKFSHVEFEDTFPQVPAAALQKTLPDVDRPLEADLHQVSGYVLFNHSSGFFARAETHWYHQRNSGYATALPGDDFFQHNLFAGYRFAHRRAEITMGILNLSDEDYHLNPLTTYAELPRKRAFTARLNFQF